MRRQIAAAVVVGLAVSACGTRTVTPPSQRGATDAPKRGGTLRVVSQSDVDSIDPGKTYGTVGYIVSNSTQRPLVNYKPDDPEHPVGDLAEAVPVVSADSRVVTVKLRRGVRFSPPVNREVTSRDVKYAIERGFFKTVANGYVGAYFADLLGAKVGAEPGTRIPGIETPDDRTVVFRLSRATGGALAGALALPLSSAVPAEYAARFDRQNPSTYGEHHVATGPYMVANDAAGVLVGYQPGVRIRLVRNPNWDAATDYKPAYLDEILIDEGHDDVGIAARQVLSGSHMVSQIGVPPEVLKDALANRRRQVVLVSTGSVDFNPLNTAIPPFDDLNVRKAAIAATDREAIQLAAGGKARGPLATHYLPPGMPGFEAAGGVAGPGADFLAAPGGDRALAARFLRAAGHASGRYEGPEQVLMVGINGSIGKAVAEIVKEGLSRVGFDVKLRLVSPETFFTKYCQVPAAKVNICIGWGWIRDFQDGQSMLDPTFNGAAIQALGNTNVSQLDVPEINQAMSRAETLADPAERARAWAEIDRLITAQAASIPALWSNKALLQSADVNATSNANIGDWDYTFTALR